jgi:hypothetical protein
MLCGPLCLLATGWSLGRAFDNGNFNVVLLGPVG